MSNLLRLSLIGRSLRYAVRRLVHGRGFSLTAIATLTLAIGCVTAAFAVVDSVLLRPLPYPQADRLMFVSHSLVVRDTLLVDQSDASLIFYGRHNQSFEQFGGYRAVSAALGPADGAAAERVSAARVTAGVLPALRVAPVRGRLTEPADDRPAAPAVVLLGEDLWRRKFGGDPAVLNRGLDIDGVPHQVVGIVPHGVRFPSADTQMWLPLALDPAHTDSASFDYQAIGRLRDGVPPAAADAEFQGLLERLPDELPGRLTRAAIAQTHMRVSVRPLRDAIVGDTGRLLWLVFAIATFVLAIAASNVANLFLVRAEARRQALAVQRALGATALDIVLEFFWEGVLIAGAAAALGVLAARATLDAVQAAGAALALPRLAEVHVTPGAAGVAAIAAIAPVFLVCALAAIRSTRAPINALGSRASTAAPDRQRARHALVVSQVALALVLLAGSGLMAQSVWRLRAVKPGFEPSQVLVFRLALPDARYRSPEEAAQFLDRAIERTAGVPGVQRVAAVSKVPLDEQGRFESAVFTSDRPLAPGSLPGMHPVVYATPGYFAAAGIRVASGRVFEPREQKDSALEAVVSGAFARRYWKDEPAIGKRVRLLINGPWYTVVGEVADVRDASLDKPADQVVYVPMLPAAEDRRWAPRDVAFVVRTAGDPSAVSGAIRESLRALDPALPLYRIRTLADVVANSSARRWVTFLLVGAASAVALVLGAIGLYGVMSYVVALRTRELAVRLALGARPAQVRRMVSRQGIGVALWGIAIGLGGALLATRALGALLYEVSPRDPLILGGAAALLLLVAAAASWLPTRRTATIDPASALNAE